jgi:hypothetical protein
MMRLSVVPLLATLACGGVTSGVHRTSNEPADPSLDDPGTRDEALAGLEIRLANALRVASGDRSAPEVRALADESVDEAVRVFGEVDDARFRARLLEYLLQLRDVRALHALLLALDDEALATPAARALAHLDLPAGAAHEASQVLAAHLPGAAADAHLALAIIAALVATNDVSATTALEAAAVGSETAHDFHVRRVAMEALGMFHDRSATGAGIRGLFVSGEDPTQRMDDAAVRTLARIGAPAVAPLTRVLRGADEDARALAAAYVDALRRESPDTELEVDQVLVEQAAAALGAIGDPAAFDALVAVAEGDDPTKSIPALVALADLDLEGQQARRARVLLESKYAAAPLEAKAQLLSVMRSRIDPASLPFLRRVARNRGTDELLRVLAFHAAVLIALGTEARPLKEIRLPDRSAIESRTPVLELALRCAEDVDCWLAEAGSEHVDELEKVAYALGRLGAEDLRAQASLRALLRHAEVRVRLAALIGLDRARAGGEIAEEIAELRAREEGQRSWAAFATAALPAAASFEAREARRRSVNEEPPAPEGAAPKGGARDRHQPRAGDRLRR